MLEKIHEDESKYDLKNMTYKEASKLIDRLEEQLDLGE
jgi:hypothetical protein